MPETLPIACSLEQSERSSRAALITGLGRRLKAVQAEGLSATLVFPASERSALDEFITGESRCCPFFAFEVAEVGDRIELDVAAPEDGEWAVRGLVAGFVAGWGGVL